MSALPERRLIITADDFGYSRAVNEAVIAAYRGGILRFTSLMVKGDAAEEAAALARENPGLGVGLHLDLCRENPEAWGLRYFLDRSLKRGLEAEISSQIERCLAWGIKPTHVDGHLNIHVHPVIFPILARLARRYQIPRLRLPGGELGVSLRHDPKYPVSRLILGGVFGAMGAYLRPHGRGLTIPERTFGLLNSGMMTEEYMVRVAAKLPPGLTEVYFHPSSDPASETRGRPTATHQTIVELRLLTSPRVRSVLEREGVKLVCSGQALE